MYLFYVISEYFLFAVNITNMQDLVKSLVSIWLSLLGHTY